MESTLREYNSLQKRNLGVFVANTWQHLPRLLLDCCYKPAIVYILRSFLTVTSTSLYQSLTKYELGLPFPLRNLPIKFGTNPSTIFLVIMVTDRHTNQCR